MQPAEPDSARIEVLDALLKRFGIKSPPPSYAPLHLALVHRSWAVENHALDNERLEFLGDAVINLVTAEYLFDLHPEASEGDLSKLRASLVSRKILGRVAQQLEIGELLLLGVGEESTGGRQRSTNLGSALEAICGAIHELYPWKTVRDSLRSFVVEPALALATERVLVDYKSILQEWTQKNLQAVPTYSVTDSRGPDHKKEFIVEVMVGSELVATGRGERKKSAENDAARNALDQLGNRPEVGRKTKKRKNKMRG